MMNLSAMAKQSSGKKKAAAALLAGASIFASFFLDGRAGRAAVGPLRNGRKLSLLGNNFPNLESAVAKTDGGYISAPVEDYVVHNAAKLGYDTQGDANAAGCAIFLDPAASDIYDELQTFQRELDHYADLIEKFDLGPGFDVRRHLETDPNVCDRLEVTPGGLPAVFPSGQLSRSSSGLVEPLLPPMRDPRFCAQRQGYLLSSLRYVVHDFAQMCRKLKRHSRTILVDMGASLQFTGSGLGPAVYLTEMYEKFGLPFDHIYAYEMRFEEPKKVYQLVPDKLKAAYHWINVGVDPTPGASMNPFTMLLDKYDEDDLIIVKLDIDSSETEMPLAMQLLNDDRLGRLVDHFYFEHHVHLEELAPWWGASMGGSVKDSLDLFSELRRKGVAAHYWP